MFAFFLEAFFWKKKRLRSQMHEYKAVSRAKKARKTAIHGPDKGYFVPKKSILMVAKIVEKWYYTNKVIKKAV